MEEKCPRWCTEPENHSADQATRFHYGNQVSVSARDRMSAVRVRAEMTTYFGKDEPPGVTLTASADDLSFTDLSPKAARVVADVIEILADVTPGKHREYAAAVRTAAEAIENEPEAG